MHHGDIDTVGNTICYYRNSFIYIDIIAERDREFKVPTRRSSKMGKLTEGTVRSVLMILRLKASQGIGILGT